MRLNEYGWYTAGSVKETLNTYKNGVNAASDKKPSPIYMTASAALNLRFMSAP
jgi:hypothetical protein